jgi:hypothetical protein
LDTPENSLRQAKEQQDRRVENFNKQLVGENAWQLAEFLIARHPAVEYTNYTNQFEFFQYGGGHLNGWSDFLKSETYPRKNSQTISYPPVGDYLDSHALLMMWRVVDRLVEEQNIYRLRLSMPFRFGYNLHDSDLVVIRIINWPERA